ncbi:serine-rich adhesin for platelets-like [Anopheles stephensi]|uniref:serine-rich adhesin for platelets-like n=1 Tax=Anopheles stephensi TaxID=30069 RepID=UPI001658848A|nr:serine-rich adhesin for platelets-like [Anopheles stephensi]
MSKLSFRARALDPSKPMPIYLAEELPDLPEYSAINRAVPQMPSGMEKEEESEHHLQRAICTGLIIPTPEVYDSTDSEFYDKYYPPDYKLPKQLIHMQPLNLEQDIPDYDMDSADEVWVTSHEKKLDLDPLKFEIMMDRLEKSSGQTVVTLNEAKALLKQDDEVSIAVYDYWLNKRLKLQHPLILYVKTENRGNMTPNNPYLAFRRRTEKMQTRKNRKNDESSYEKMLKLRRDLSRAVTLLDMIKRREKLKREQLHLSIEIYEKRYQAQDFHGHLLSEFTSNATRVTRPAFAPIYTNQYAPLAGQGVGQGANAVGSAGAYLNSGGSSSQYEAHGTGSSGTNKRDNESLSSRKEKRQYKKRKLKMQKDRGLASGTGGGGGGGGGGAGVTGGRGDAAGGLNSTSGLGSSGLHHHHQQQPHQHYHGSMLGGVGGRGVDGTVVGGHGTDHHHHHLHGSGDHVVSSDDEELSNLQGSSAEEEYAYAFRRSKHSQYHRPRADGYGNWPWTSREENGSADPRYRFNLTSLRYPRPRCIGFARRRLGRGGRVIIDRIATDFDDLWSRLDYTIVESETIASLNTSEPTKSRDDAKEEENNEPIVIPCRRRQIERTASVSSNCSNTSSGAGVVVSLKPPPRLPAIFNHQNPPLVNGSDGPPVTNGDGITPRTIVFSRRKLVLKQEPAAMSDCESDGAPEIQFLTSIGLMNKTEKESAAAAADELSGFASTKRRLRFDSEEREGESGEVTKDGSGGGGGGGVCDERTLKTDVRNSDSIVIKSEDGTGTGTELVVMSTGRIKQEPDAGGADGYQKPSVPVGEDFEQLIDSVNSNNHARTRFSVTTAAATTEASSNSISSATNDVSAVPNSSQQSHAVNQAEGGSPSRLHDATPEDINAVYKDLLNDIQSNWLHFRPKTPEPSQDDLLTLDGEEDDMLEHCLGLTDRHRITLELQSLDEQLPGTIFSPAKGTTLSSLFRTAPYDLDSLIEPHPLSLAEGDSSSGAKGAAASPTVEVKLETSGSSASGENNLSVPSELNLSLNESSEDNEKMLDNILQECAIDDPKQLHQTSNFWNGILDDGVLNNLETGAGGQTEDEPMVEENESGEARTADLFTSSSAKIGYHSELVGYGRPAGAADRRTSKSKRRKMLKRCSYLVGSSYFSVKSLPKEEIFQPLLDANGQPIILSDGVDLDSSSVDPMAAGEQNELRDAEDTSMQSDSLLQSSALGGGVEAMEIKMEEDASASLAAAAAEESVPGEPLIKLEPPEEQATSAASDAGSGGGCDATLLGNTPTTVQFLPHNSTTMAAPAATTIKLEPFNHISQIAARSSTPDGARVVPTGSTTLIPATIVVSQPPSSTGNGSAMFQTTSGTVPAVVSVSLQQGSLHQLVHTSSAPSMGAGTTMLVMQSIPSVQSSPSASVAGTPTSFLLSNAGSNTGSILVQTSASSSLANNVVQSASASSANSLLSASAPIVVTVPPASSSGLSAAAQPISGTNTVVSIATPIVVSSASAASLAQSIVHAQSQAAASAASNSASSSSTGGTTTTALNSYIVQHNSTPIMLSHQQMQQLANSGGGNIVTVGGQQVVTTKQHHGETFVLTQTPLKKQINGPSDGNKNATATATVNAQNINNQKFHALLSHKLGSKPSDLNKKQLEMIRKALGSSQKMFVKSTNHGQQLHAGTASGSAGLAGHHQQTSAQQQPQYNVIHQNSLNTPITIVSAQSPGQPTQNKIILTSSPHLLQQATAVGGATAGQLIAASHGKIQLTTVQQGQQQQQTGQVTTGPAGGQILTLDPTGGQQGGGGGVSGVQQQLKLEKNRILYNIKNSRGQFLHLNPKMVNIIQPVQQQKIVNSLTIQQQQQAQQQQQQQQQQLLHNQAGHGGTTTILSKGQTVQRIPTVSIRTQQQAQQQQQQAQQQQAAQQQQQTNLVDMVVVNNANNIKFIQAAASAAAAAAAAGGGNVVNNSTATSRVNAVTTASVGSLNASSSESGTSSGSSSSGSNCVQQVATTLSTSVANSVNSSSSVVAGGSASLANSSGGSAPVSVATVTSTTAGTAGTVVGSGGGGGGGSSNGSGGGSGAVTGSAASTNPSASINITNR